MSRYREIKIGGKVFEGLFTTRAMINIAELVGGDISKIGDWLNADTTDTAKTLKKTAQLAAEIINGATAARNADIGLGLATGEKKPLINADYLIDIFEPGELTTITYDVMACMRAGNEYEIPEGITLEEKDRDLEEIRKNVKAAAD
ncbi:MAG: hypothetical protein LUI05_03070 [Oscillospiraceae bacterium]|nr:hypothetical protein [Oscillospiraceae bacterium]